jgi:hypothetical protein
MREKYVAFHLYFFLFASMSANPLYRTVLFKKNRRFVVIVSKLSARIIESDRPTSVLKIIREDKIRFLLVYMVFIHIVLQSSFY